MKINRFALTTIILAGLSGTAHAVDGNAEFSGEVGSTCILTTATPGVLTPSTDLTTLRSSNASGVPALVTAVTNSSTFGITTIAPSGFTAGDATGVTFSSNYSFSGATTRSTTNGTLKGSLNPGLTNVNVGLNADKVNGAFEANTYTATVTVRCE